jgi:site-specific DNA-cytosine methylase
MSKKILELFSGTHSIGKEAEKLGYEVYSLDRDIGSKCPFGSNYESKNHFKEDIMTFDFKQFPKGYFHVITASPVCLWWSHLRRSWIGRKIKAHGDKIITEEILEEDIKKYGEPMVDKIFEIIDYLEPSFWWIENPQTGKMKEYINDLIPFYDVDYCMYGFNYKKKTRFWTNIKNFNPKICNGKCKALIDGKIHKSLQRASQICRVNGKIIRINTKELRLKHKDLSKEYGGGCNRLDRYRIPSILINELLSCCNT